jgi:uncharacterized protein YaiI (UPF0178 family)
MKWPIFYHSEEDKTLINKKTCIIIGLDSKAIGPKGEAYDSEPIGVSMDRKNEKTRLSEQGSLD